VLKWKTEQGKYGHSLLTPSLLEHSLAALAAAYDERAAIEAEIKADKGGLQLHRRRKRRLAAQEALILRVCAILDDGGLWHHLRGITRRETSVTM
jgi:hypothetical protein